LISNITSLELFQLQVVAFAPGPLPEDFIQYHGHTENVCSAVFVILYTLVLAFKAIAVFNHYIAPTLSRHYLHYIIYRLQSQSAASSTFHIKCTLSK